VEAFVGRVLTVPLACLRTLPALLAAIAVTSLASCTLGGRLVNLRPIPEAQTIVVPAGIEKEHAFGAITTALEHLNGAFARNTGECFWTLESNQEQTLVVKCKRADFYSARYSIQYDARRIVIGLLDTENLRRTEG
jgi:hypothetical protein